MFVKIVRAFDKSIEVWIMGDPDNGVRIYDLDIQTDEAHMEAVETIKDFLAVVKDFPVVCLEITSIITQADLELILI